MLKTSLLEGFCFVFTLARAKIIAGDKEGVAMILTKRKTDYKVLITKCGYLCLN